MFFLGHQCLEQASATIFAAQAMNVLARDGRQDDSMSKFVQINLNASARLDSQLAPYRGRDD
jgi:hypothetical protein